MPPKRRTFDMGLGIILESPDALNLIETNLCDHLDDAEAMFEFNSCIALPDDVIICEQQELLCLTPQRHSEGLDTIGVPIQDRLTVFEFRETDDGCQLCPIEGEVVDKQFKDKYERVRLSQPAFTGPFANPEDLLFEDLVIVP